MIFHIHLYLHLGSRRTLLLTCRLWYNLLIDCGYMWKQIAWPEWNDEVSLASCYNLRLLAHIVGRNSEPFNLALVSPTPNQVTMGELHDFMTSMRSNWLIRCRSLSLLLKGFDAPVSVLEKLLHDGNFQSLEHLSLEGDVEITEWNMLANVISQIDKTAPNIERLDIGDGVPLQLIFHYFSILTRISSLNISFCYLPNGLVPWGQLINLRHLQISQGRDDYEILGLEQIVAPNLVSLHLNGDFTVENFFSDQVMQKITHMVLEDFHDTWLNVFQCALPKLTF